MAGITFANVRQRIVAAMNIAADREKAAVADAEQQDTERRRRRQNEGGQAAARKSQVTNVILSRRQDADATNKTILGF